MGRHCWESGRGRALRELPSTTPALETLGFSLSGKYLIVYTLTWMEAERVGEIFKASKEVQLMDEP